MLKVSAQFAGYCVGCCCGTHDVFWSYAIAKLVEFRCAVAKCAGLFCKWGLAYCVYHCVCRDSELTALALAHDTVFCDLQRLCFEQQLNAVTASCRSFVSGNPDRCKRLMRWCFWTPFTTRSNRKDISLPRVQGTDWNYPPVPYFLRFYILNLRHPSLNVANSIYNIYLMHIHHQ